MPPIPQDGATRIESVDDATEALLKKWSATDEDATELSDESENDEDTEQEVEEEEETESEDAEEPSEDEEETDDSETDDEEAEEEEDTKPKKVAKDDLVVKVKVGDEELDVSVKDLKRLYGQEAALTKKSQAVAAKTKEVEEQGAKYVAALGAMLNKARERAEPFAKIDWLVAAKNLNEDELTALRNEAARHMDDLKFYEQELDQVMGQVHQQQRLQLQEAAKECVEVLKRDIPGWNEKLYDEIRGFAINSGLDVNIVNNLVDPAAFKMLHMAMLYNKGKTAQTKKIVKTPKKLVKTSTSAEATKKVISNKNTDNANARLAKTGRVEDAADAFLARWQLEE